MSKTQEPSVVVVRLMLVLTVSLLPLVAAAQTVGSVSPKFDLAEVAGSPFPTDLYTVLDASQVTGHRVDLPKPDCSLRPSDCKDIDVLNKLDGFNLQPRLAIPFSGAIDVNSVNSSNVFLIGARVTRSSSAPTCWIRQVIQLWRAPSSSITTEAWPRINTNASIGGHSRMRCTRRVTWARGGPTSP